MTWVLKAFIQRAIGLLPVSERINYTFQKRITKNLPVSDETLDEKIMLAAKRVELFLKFGGGISLADAKFLEFGAGWDMIGPLTMFALGVGKQTLLDITPHLRFELINNALDRLRKRTARFIEITGKTSRTFSDGDVLSKKDLLERFAIDYRAPLDAANTGFPANSIDFICTNSTLEHIPAPALLPIMNESYRILKHGGVLCHLIDMKDHYSYFDKSISKYNFLKFSKSFWKIFNSPLQYQNRLRLSQYRSIIKNAGFEIVYEEVDEANSAELQELRSIKLHPDFKNKFTEPDLSAKIYRVVAKKIVH